MSSPLTKELREEHGVSIPEESEWERDGWLVVGCRDQGRDD